MITEKLQKKIDSSIRLLQSVQKRYDGEIEIAYSGGKDSDVILQLAVLRAADRGGNAKSGRGH